MSNLPKDIKMPTKVLHGHSGWVRCVAVSPEGFRAASGGDDGTLRIWQIYDGQELSVDNLGSPVTCVCYGDDDIAVVAGCKDGTIHYWGGLGIGGKSGVLQGAADLDTGWIQALDFIPETDSIVFSVQPTPCDLIRTAWLGGNGWKAPCNDLYLDGNCIAVEPEGKWLAVGSIGKISVFGLQDSDPPDPLYEIECSDSITALAIGEGGEIVAGDDEGMLTVWDSETQEQTLEWKGHEFPGQISALDVRQHKLVSASQDSTVRAWDLNSGECRAILHHGTGSVVLGVSMRHSGKRVFSAGSDGLFVWDLDAPDVWR
ncbi:MAG: WD40 repeat domain-containing protein [Terracidiphilus sp.]